MTNALQVLPEGNATMLEDKKNAVANEITKCAGVALVHVGTTRKPIRPIVFSSTRTPHDAIVGTLAGMGLLDGYQCGTASSGELMRVVTKARSLRLTRSPGPLGDTLFLGVDAQGRSECILIEKCDVDKVTAPLRSARENAAFLDCYLKRIGAENKIRGTAIEKEPIDLRH
jgi:hypothetical protein